MKNVLIIAISLLAFTSCSNKKLVVMSKGAAKINSDAGTIQSTDGAGHEENAVLTGTQEWTIESPSGKGSFELAEKGLYVVNAKNDTIIGSFQSYFAGNSYQKIRFLKIIGGREKRFCC